jgi:excisionase family DNA binding protein
VTKSGCHIDQKLHFVALAHCICHESSNGVSIMVDALPPQVPPYQWEPLLLKADEAAAQLKISPRSLWQYTKSGELPCVRMGRSVRYAPADLEAFIVSRKGTNHAEA